MTPIPSCIRFFRFWNWIIIFLSFHLLRLNIFFLFSHQKLYFSCFIFFYLYSNEILINFNELFQGFTYSFTLNSYFFIIFFFFFLQRWVISSIFVWKKMASFLTLEKKVQKILKFHKNNYQFLFSQKNDDKSSEKNPLRDLRGPSTQHNVFKKTVSSVFLHSNSEQHTKKIVHVQLLLLEAPLSEVEAILLVIFTFFFFLSLSLCLLSFITTHLLLFFFHPLWRIFNYFAPSILHHTLYISQWDHVKVFKVQSTEVAIK